MPQYEETVSSVQRMQIFSPDSLPRVEELGQEINFTNALAPAERLVDLYKRVSVEALKDFPDNLLKQIMDRANADYAVFKQILDFKFQGQGNPEQTQTNYINQVVSAYQTTFGILKDVISYSACRTTDFKLIEQEARGVFQGIRDKAEQITGQLEGSKEEANRILEEVRNVAAEQGVSQQAIYFRKESELHETESEEWKIITVCAAAILVIVSASFLFLHKWNFLSPKNNFEALQFVASKIFVFATLSYLLYLSGKNFLSHKHNAIVNRHRQNALMTYQAISDASSTVEGKEIILAQAAYCMFSPQETGYIKVVSGDSGASMKTFIDAIPKASIKIN